MMYVNKQEKLWIRQIFSSYIRILVRTNDFESWHRSVQIVTIVDIPGCISFLPCNPIYEVTWLHKLFNIFQEDYISWV